MKNSKIVYVLLFYIALLFLVSCQKEISSILNNTESGIHAEWITLNDFIDFEHMNIYCESDNIYFESDADAKISLYVDAERNDNDEFMFDDGQEWMLVMKTSLGNYPLFPRKYVQLGMVDYTAFHEYDSEGDSIFHVLVTVRQSAAYQIYDCVFDNDKNAFNVVIIYNASNINPVGNSR